MLHRFLDGLWLKTTRSRKLWIVDLRIWAIIEIPGSLDVLHVACALELRLRHFMTFDDRQSHLARTVGLRLVAI